MHHCGVSGWWKGKCGVGKGEGKGRGGWGKAAVGCNGIVAGTGKWVTDVFLC